jgi:hypothetical protein
MKLCLILLGVFVLLLIALPIGTALAKSRITPGEPTPYKKLRSLGDVIATAPNNQIHIIYVHGMRAEGPGASGALRGRLEQSFGKRENVKRTRHYLNLQPWPQGARVGDRLIWDTEEDWKKGQPFIDRYVLHTTDPAATITIDEVNWWPLVFPLKCRVLLQPEARVTGVDTHHLGLCADDNPPYHAWITQQDYNKARATKAALGGGAAGNRYLKQQILDWGLSDAVIATGPMRVYLNAAMDEAFAYASGLKTTVEYVLISESLGSFVVLDAYANDKPAVNAVLDATYNLYFFANQFSLLELARISNVPDTAAGARSGAALQPTSTKVQVQDSPLAALKRWAGASAPRGFLASPSSVKQIISFSDPSDALTFPVPAAGSAQVSNVYVRNTGSLFGLFADPVKAHSGQMKNSTLWEAMIGRNSPRQ